MCKYCVLLIGAGHRAFHTPAAVTATPASSLSRRQIHSPIHHTATALVKILPSCISDLGPAVTVIWDKTGTNGIFLTTRRQILLRKRLLFGYQSMVSSL